jgi:hypothetical protein
VCILSSNFGKVQHLMYYESTVGINCHLICSVFLYLIDCRSTNTRVFDFLHSILFDGKMGDKEESPCCWRIFGDKELGSSKTSMRYQFD